MLAIDPKKDRLEFVPKCDRALPKEDQTVFVCRPLSVSEEALVSDLSRYNEDGTLTLNNYQKAVLAFRLAVEGVRNLRDGAGKEVAIDREETGLGLLVSEKFLGRVGTAVVVEVGSTIRKASKIEEDEAGN